LLALEGSKRDEATTFGYPRARVLNSGSKTFGYPRLVPSLTADGGLIEQMRR
jgi:hypothetical protein